MGSVDFVDLAICFGINLGISSLFLFLYSLLKVQPINARVYFTRWFILDDKGAHEEYEKGNESKLVYSWRAYLYSLDWILVALKKPERELLQHAGLDMVVYLRMFKLGVKLFLPVSLVAAAVLFPVYYTAGYLQNAAGGYTEVDYITMSNLQAGSPRYWVPWLFAWLFSIYALHALRTEYEAVAQLRLDYLADQKRSPQQYTVLVRQVPYDPTRTVAQQTAQFFSVVHKDHYLMSTPVFDARKLSQLENQRNDLENRLTALQIQMERKGGVRPVRKTKCCGLMGPTEDSIEVCEAQLAALSKEIVEERDRIMSDKDSIMPANFVSFRSRWGAAVAAQTQQSKDNTKWLATWAPEPRDVLWSNLPINYFSLTTRRFVAGAVTAGTILASIIPVCLIQGLASINNILQYAPFLQPVADLPFINSLLTSVLPGLGLMGLMALLPRYLRILSMMEGYVSKSQLDRAAAGKMFLFMLFAVFLANVILGTAWTDIPNYFKKPDQIPRRLGSTITASSSFFITFTMVTTWMGMANEIVRFKDLVLFHIKNSLLVRTPAERVKAMSASGPNYVALLPQVELYFLLAFMFWIVAPLYIPFAVVFFLFGYIVYRNQFLNVYTPEYDLGGGHWPHFHNRVVTSLILAQIVLILVLLLRYVIVVTILLVPLPLVTYLYNTTYITAAYERTFSFYALEEAMKRDTIDKVTHPNENPRSFLAGAYLHPSLISAYELPDVEEGGGKGGGQGASEGDPQSGTAGEADAAPLLQANART